MDSPVVELQRLASDNSVPISALLRKSLVVATKLGLEEFRTWVQLELNGYPDVDSIPTYRILTSSYHYENPHNGLQPIILPDEELKRRWCTVHCTEPVQSIQHSLETTSSGEEAGYTVPVAVENAIRKQFPWVNAPIVRLLSSNSLVCILEAVRNRVLECALQLESEGILGHELVFSSEEKAKAQTSQIINIEYFQGVWGNVSQSTVQQSFIEQVKEGDIESLMDAMRKLGFPDEDLIELREALEAEKEVDKDGGFGPRVYSWLGKLGTGALKVGQDVSTAVITAAIKAHYGMH